MPKSASQKPAEHKPDPNKAVVDAVNRVTGSEPVRGEDLLPPELREAYLAAKRKSDRDPLKDAH